MSGPNDYPYARRAVMSGRVQGVFPMLRMKYLATQAAEFETRAAEWRRQKRRLGIWASYALLGETVHVMLAAAASAAKRATRETP